MNPKQEDDQRTYKLTKDKDSLEQNIISLKENEEKFRLVFENVNEAIAVIQDEVVVYCNPQIADLTGYSTEEVRAMNFSEFIHPVDLELVRLEYEKRLSGEKPNNRYSVRILKKDGQEKFVLISSTLVEWDNGPATLTMISDITQLKKAESDLKKGEERFRLLMEQSPMAMELLTPDGKIEVYNPAWKRLWNLETDEEALMVIDKYNMLTDPQVESLGIMDMVREAFNGQHVILPPIQYDAGQTAEDFDIKGLKAFRSPWIQCHIFPVKDEDGNIIQVVNTYVDITDLRSAEQEAHVQRDALARIDRASSMGQLTGSIAHEINQPLTGVLSNAQAAELLIKGGRLDRDELAEIMEEIVSDTKRAGEVIRNLRELYREQKGEFFPVNLNTIVKETMRLLHSEFVMHHIILTVNYKSSIPEVYGNKVQIQQVLVNLIMNGIQAMSNKSADDRQLVINTEYDSKEARLWVEDSGMGIDDEKIDHIFDPLATWKPGGTGMGLAISNSIISAHGGRMWAKNRPVGGARVGFAIPITNGDR